MKILHITDSHGTVKKPESRKDKYYLSFLMKLYELGIVIRRNDIDAVIHTGDLFHTARVSDKFAGQVSQIIKSWDVPVYVVPGNHDMEGYNIDTLDQTKLGLLAKAEVIKILDRKHPSVFSCESYDNNSYTVAISGQEYYAHIDEGNSDDFKMNQTLADINILCYHGFIADAPQHPNIKCTMYDAINTDADIILCGHYHKQYSILRDDFDIYNPGSMMRIEQNEYNKNHIPTYGILEINLDSNQEIEYDYNFYKFKKVQPSSIVFDYTTAYNVKNTQITLENFKTSIANTVSNLTTTNNITSIITSLCIDDKGNHDKNLETAVMDLYTNSFNDIPDNFDVKQGYVESLNKKTIKSVYLHNFQSHADTEVKFDDGLNVIIGESNNGKTSILRAIMWVIDNYPLGTDFIMAGKNECWVQILFSDGSTIKRSRTLTDTGSYKISYYDENNSLQVQEYKGFANAVPVEIDNIHQMPKINITKDIETHLNVASQLDPPFLLTESPAVKANAIGRITGTHITDNAIRETNKTITGNKKIIKQYTEDLEEQKNKLATIPNLDKIKDLLTNRKNIMHYVDKCNQDFEYINSMFNEHISIINSITWEENSVACFNSVLKIKGLYTYINNEYTFFKDIYVLYERYKSINDDIQVERNKLDTCMNILENEDTIVELKELCNYIITVNKSCTKLNEHSFTIINMHKLYIKYNKFINSVKTLLSYIQQLFSECKQITNLFNNLQNVDGEIRKHTVEYNVSVNNKQDTLAAYERIVNEKNQMILQNGICPCCQQPITEEHIPYIESYLKKA